MAAHAWVGLLTASLNFLISISEEFNHLPVLVLEVHQLCGELILGLLTMMSQLYDSCYQALSETLDLYHSAHTSNYR